MSPAACVAAGLLPPGGAFNPLTLSGLVWFLHPDDATDIVSGEINSLVCRKSGLTFTASAAVNRMPYNTSERPGHAVAQSATLNADALRNPTLGSALDGATAFTIFHYRRLTSTGSTQAFIQHSVGTGYSASGDRIETFHNGTSNAVNMVDQGVGNTSLSVTRAQTTNWEFHMRTWNNGTFEFFVDNVSIGTATGSHRTLSGMVNVLWGGGLAYHSVSGCCLGVMGAAERTNLYNWILAKA